MVRHPTFFLTSAYFENGNTSLMSDLTDNQFYLTHPKRVTVWCGFWSVVLSFRRTNMVCIHLNKWACNRLTEDADFGKKKIIFSEEAHFDLGGYVNKQNCRVWSTENPYAYIEKPTHPKRVTVWCGSWCKGIIEPFFFENE